MIRGFSCLIAIIFLVSCSTFRGPGQVKAPESSGPPAIAWNGDRRDSDDSGETKVAFDWPLDEARMTRGFQVGPHKHHWGVDLANKKNTPILAAEKGTVIYTGHGFHGYGNLIVIEHGKEWATLYSHLAKFLVKEGEQVERGQKIALMGRTGDATGVHLHFEIRHNREPVNPLQYLPEGY